MQSKKFFVPCGHGRKAKAEAIEAKEMAKEMAKDMYNYRCNQQNNLFQLIMEYKQKQAGNYPEHRVSEWI